MQTYHPPPQSRQDVQERLLYLVIIAEDWIRIYNFPSYIALEEMAPKHDIIAISSR